MKVTTVEEAHDIDNIRVDVLIGSLQTVELAISNKSEKNNKSIDFISNVEDDKDQAELDTDKDLSNTIVLLGNQFNWVLKRLDRRGKPDAKNISYDTSNNLGSQNKTRT